MAKKTTVAPAAPAAKAEPTKAQIKTAIKCICAITGCGQIDAEARMKRMTSANVIKIAELDDSGHRREAIPILYS